MGIIRLHRLAQAPNCLKAAIDRAISRQSLHFKHFQEYACSALLIRFRFVPNTGWTAAIGTSGSI